MIPAIDAPDLMHATHHRAPFSHENWIFELKYDGYRCLVRKFGSRVELISCQGKCMNRSFPDVVAALERVPGSFVWDAELTVDEPTGQSSFERVQVRARTSVATRVRASMKLHPARLHMFDLLAAGARDLRALSLIERKKRLVDTFEDTAVLICVTRTAAVGGQVFEQVGLHNFEGMVAKRIDSTYQAGRCRNWLKFKNANYSRPAARDFGRL
jgi:bifunctional non-homologous end joining protein LigD